MLPVLVCSYGLPYTQQAMYACHGIYGDYMIINVATMHLAMCVGVWWQVIH